MTWLWQRVSQIQFRDLLDCAHCRSNTNQQKYQIWMKNLKRRSDWRKMRSEQSAEMCKSENLQLRLLYDLQVHEYHIPQFDVVNQTRRKKKYPRHRILLKFVSSLFRRDKFMNVTATIWCCHPHQTQENVLSFWNQIMGTASCFLWGSLRHKHLQSSRQVWQDGKSRFADVFWVSARSLPVSCHIKIYLPRHFPWTWRNLGETSFEGLPFSPANLSPINRTSGDAYRWSFAAIFPVDAGF